MKRRGVIRRSAVASLALVSATVIVSVGTGGAAMAEPSAPLPPKPASKLTGAKPTAKLAAAKPAEVVPDRYIVVLKDKKATPAKIKAAASALAKENGGSVRRLYSSAVNGYSAAMSVKQAGKLAADPDVASVEPVVRFHKSGTQTSPPSWGLDRIDQVSPKLSGSYTYPNTGAGVKAYIVDTGIDINHSDFGGRASHGYDAVDQDNVAQDCNGHGTHVAGTVGGTKFGVAKNVNLVAVRVLDCEGSGTTEQVLAGIDWVTANAQKPAVVNMSLGGPHDPNYPAISNAVSNSIATGLTYAVAAGNEADDACSYTPARVSAAITVGATDRIDRRASTEYFDSNFGPCVDVWAPGVDIVSAASGTTDGSVAFSGTSMAAPHVAGAAALLLQSNPSWSPSQVRNTIVTRGLAGAVLNPQGGVDRLLNVASALSPARTSHGLLARSNGYFVSADGAGSKPLAAVGPVLGGWEKLDIVDAGNGLVALRANVNGKYVSATGAGTKPLIAVAASVSTWERFQLLHNIDGTVSLKATVNNKFVSAPNNGGPLVASAATASTWEKFDLETNLIVSFKSAASGKYVSADGAGSKPLIPLVSSVGTWEKFELFDLDYYGYFGLRSLANGKYVSATGAGTKPMLASAPTIDAWEAFTFWHRGVGATDGSGWIYANVDGQAVSAGSAGTSQLIPNKDFDFWTPDFGLSAGERYVINLA
ncbi:peptidase S8 [Micromonospora acroterricola]|uniref:Peptidase S8 n=1 Tax=Micromonospora acroterricola TaxID=2202421 RepID=A0A317DA67_9ACTN|nr:S8 family serine peptidase [Micromonospora acroterricola]PWR09535.1 peptidase S8 [Micromonospora acroterricola]